MLVSLFDQYGALNSPPVFAAIQQGLAASGIKHCRMNLDADVAVIWSVLWAGRMRPNLSVWQHFKSQNKTVIVAEVGMIQRGHTWKLGLNGTGLNSTVALPMLANRARDLGIKIKPWANSGQNVVIACQRHDSDQWAGQVDTAQWLRHTMANVRSHSSRPIVVRQHPRQNLSSVDAPVQKPKPLAHTYDSFDFDQALQNAWCVINWNSGPGSQAILSGVPAFVGPNSLAAPVGNLDWTQIENPIRPDRSQWVEMLAHTEWTLAELATGYPMRRLLGLESG